MAMGNISSAASFYPHSNYDAPMFREEIGGTARSHNSKGIAQLVHGREGRKPNLLDSK